MMPLQDKLDTQKANFEKNAPPEILEVKLTFEILSDPGNQVAGRFALVHTLPEDLKKIYLQFGIDLPRHNGDDSWTLPLAARFIIDREAVIRYAEVDADYTLRPDPEHTLKALKSIL
jgi:peroxiredoxin